MMSRAGQGVGGGGHFLLGVDVLAGLGLTVEVALLEEKLRQRLEASLLGDGRSRPPLGTERQVDVFEDAERLGGVDLGLELVGELVLVGEALENGGPPLVELAKLVESVANADDGHFVEPAGDLLAVAGNEGNRRGAVEQFGDRADLSAGNAELRGDLLDVVVGQDGGVYFCVSHTCCKSFRTNCISS